jgi:hypothetical protein
MSADARLRRAAEIARMSAVRARVRRIGAPLAALPLVA